MQAIDHRGESFRAEENIGQTAARIFSENFVLTAGSLTTQQMKSHSRLGYFQDMILPLRRSRSPSIFDIRRSIHSLPRGSHEPRLLAPP